MNIKMYPLGAQWGVLVDETYERIFDTKQEALQMSDKLIKAAAVQQAVTMLSGINPLLEIINAREYGQGQAQAITDADIVSLNITAADFQNAQNLLAQVEELLTNAVPVQADYMPVVNKVRSD